MKYISIKIYFRYDLSYYYDKIVKSKIIFIGYYCFKIRLYIL